MITRTKSSFTDHEKNTLTMKDQIFKPRMKQKWTPNKNHHTVLTYIEATRRELEKEQTKMKRKKYNVTKNEKTSMKELSE